MRALRTALFLATSLGAVPLILAPLAPASAQIGIGVNISIAPPELPVYEQPPLPAEGWLWNPGYWAYGDEGYYWVPGTWVEPPQPGLLWTPGYWGYNEGAYVFNQGYWGPHVGFYGGVNYGYGYNGAGYFGGEWRGGVFAYNRDAVRDFGGVHVTNVYNQTIVVNRTTNVSYNGGPRGIEARPTQEQVQYSHEPHVQRTALQDAHIHAAAQNRELLASANHGHPAIAATARPNEFKGPGVVPAREAVVHPAAAAEARPGAARPGEAGRPREVARPAGVARPGDVTRPGSETARRGAVTARPGSEAERRGPAPVRAEAARPEASSSRRAEAARPAAAAPRERPEAARPAEVARPHVEAARPEAARPVAPRPEAPHVAAPRAPEMRPAARPAEPRHEEGKPKR
jgi:hypothetical protein